MQPVQQLQILNGQIDRVSSALGGIQNVNIRQVAELNQDLSHGIREIVEIKQSMEMVVGAFPMIVETFKECLMDIAQIIIEKLIRRALKFLWEKVVQSNLGSAILKLLKIIANMWKIVNLLIESKLASLIKLIQRAKEAIFYQRILIINELTERFGGVVDNINELLGKIDILDLCDFGNFLQGGAFPKPQKIIYARPEPFPLVAPPQTVNAKNIIITDKYHDTMAEVNYAIANKENIADSETGVIQPAYVEMMTILGNLAYAVENRISDTAVPGNVGSGVNTNEFIRNIRTNAEKELQLRPYWSSEVVNEFNRRFEAMVGAYEQGGTNVQEYSSMMHSNVHTIGALGSAGVTWYGYPPLFITGSSGIQTPVPGGKANGWDTQTADDIIKGHMKGSWADKGAWGANLTPGVSCASSRYPGGSKLLITHPDGKTPYNPAGYNSEGIYEVEDTGHYIYTFNKVDIFLPYITDYNAAKKYSCPSNRALIYLVEKGTKTHKNYTKAWQEHARLGLKNTDSLPRPS